MSCCSHAGVCWSSSGLRGEKGLDTVLSVEDQGLKRTVLMGTEPVCWLQQLGMPLVRAMSGLCCTRPCCPCSPTLFLLFPGVSQDLFQSGAARVPLAITTHLRVLQIQIQHSRT